MTKTPILGTEVAENEVKSVNTLIAILEHIENNGPVGVTELSEALDMSKGGVHRYLKTLVSHGYAINKTGTYDLGLRFLTLGGYVRNTFPHTNLIEQKVKKLSKQTGQRVQFLSEEQGYGIYLYRERSPNAAQFDAAIGRQVYLHTTAAGKVILANLPEEYVEQIIEVHGLKASTENTITEPDTLFKSLETIREQGYALTKGEHLPGVHSLGVPIFDSDGEISVV